MYAVVRTGGKQYRVAPGELLKVEKLEGAAGQKVELDDVLLIADGETVHVGRPKLDGAKVAAEIVEQDRHRKVLVFKYKRRKRYRLRKGHRQQYTAVKIDQIEA